MNWQLVAAGLLLYATAAAHYVTRIPSSSVSRITQMLRPIIYVSYFGGFIALYILIKEMGLLYGLLIAVGCGLVIEPINRLLPDGGRSIVGLLTFAIGLGMFFLLPGREFSLRLV